jgi:hypothetical protein
MSEKTVAQASRELQEAWLDLVSAILPWFVRPVDWLNRSLQLAVSLIHDTEEGWKRDE